LQRIDRHVDRLATEEVTPVAADVEGDVLALRAGRGLEVSLAPARDLGILQAGHLGVEARRRDRLLVVVDHPLRDRLVGRGRRSLRAGAGEQHEGGRNSGGADGSGREAPVVVPPRRSVKLRVVDDQIPPWYVRRMRTAVSAALTASILLLASGRSRAADVPTRHVEFLSEPYTIDRIYKSMAGPEGKQI